MSTPNPAPLFRTLGNGRFAMPDQYRPGVTLLLTLDQIKLYLQHDADLRGGIEPTTIPSPVGYDKFAVALNSNAENGIQVALVLEDNTRVRIKGRPPTLAELVRLNATRRVVTTHRDPREEAGGKWLDSHHMELMECCGTTSTVFASRGNGERRVWPKDRPSVSVERTKKPSDPLHL
ncbi:hypothetical protein BDR06DRAFT_1041455 [Suillus hirtellus]|nr:hypothetical protein BDR06DRAFT_1041455 [Suillus hirtellus]